MKIIFVILFFLACVKTVENTTIPGMPVEFIQQFLGHITGYTFSTVPSTSATISEECARQLKVISRNQSIALAMLDASSKFPYPGLLYASRIDYGNYDECMGIHFDDGADRIFGKYCISGLVIPDMKDPTNINMMYKLATCIPDKCTAEDLISLGINVFSGFPPIFTDDYCTSKDDDDSLSVMNIVVITFFGFILVLMVCSTFMDYFMHKKNVKWNSQLMAFSVYSNMPKLLKTSTNLNDQIQVFHGIKVISMLWIVAGHGYTIWMAGFMDNVAMLPVHNHKDLETFHEKMYSSYMDGAHFAVDSFFFIAGFLVTYHYVAKMKNVKILNQLKSIPALYTHRILRISIPAYMVFFFAMWIFPIIGEGPIWKPAVPIARGFCEDYWWAYFLYVQNYYNYQELCLTHTWYLSADMQMFFVAPFVLIPITLLLRTKNGLKKTLYVLFGLTVTSIALPIYFAITFTNYNNIYSTHTRFVDYLMGITMAVFMNETKCTPFLQGVNQKWKSITNLIIWSVTLTGMFVSLLYYSNAEVYQGLTSKAFYYILSRTAWCIGLCWLVYSCHLGYGGIINWILCRPIFQVVGKLTYSMYLLHFLVIGYHILRNRSKIFFSDYTQYFTWCGYAITTLIVSIVWTLAFESPVGVLEKAIFGHSRNSPKETSQGANVDNNGESENQNPDHLTA